MKKFLYIIALVALIVPSTCLLSACACSFFGADTYKVTFIDWDDTVIDEQTVNSGENAVPPTNPTRTGYTFDSWEGDYQNVTSDVIIKAKYNINAYTVTFKDYDDTVLSNQTIEYGEGATAPTEPTREGYTFTGWDKSFNNITSNIIVKAVYEEVVEPISIVGDWKTSALGLNITEENLEGDIFSVGENYGEGLLEEDYFYATFTETQATINHLGNNYVVEYSIEGEVFVTEEIEDISGYYQFTPSQEGKLKVEVYLTDGLADGYILLIEGKPTVNPEPETFTVTFKDWNGDILDEQTVNSGEAAIAPEIPIREGFTFVRWDPQDFTNITSNLEVVAIYDEDIIQTFTVTFTDWNGAALDEQTVNEGEAASAPADPVREGYTFTGWDPADFTNIVSDLTITATYTENAAQTFTVIFKDWDESTLSEQVVNKGEAAVAPAEPIREGYTFTGWDSTDYMNVTTDLTIVAIYTENTVQTFTVIFKDWDGSILSTQTINGGESAVAPADPTREGSTFTGWDPADFTNVMSDLTITATYADITTFTVTFKDWDNAVLSTQTVNEGEAATAPADPIREGYTFTGWSPANFTNVTSNMTIVATYAENVTDVIVGTWANGISYTDDTYETTTGDIGTYSFTFESDGTLTCILGETYSGTWTKNDEDYSVAWNEGLSMAVATITENNIRISDASTFWWQFTKNA